MFTTESENRVYGLKPMNCPGHVQIFNAGLHSYRELPLRYGEFGQCHRNEPSGSLHGMMRVRGFTQDDGHIFCTEDQLQDECAAFTRLLQRVYADFGFTEILYKVATRPEKRIGADEVWDKAEKALMDSLDLSHCEYEVSEGEGAFYGPKIEYTLKDAIGRHWQCGTIQVDFSMPARLGAEYVDAQDQRRTPVMLHRAILGSLERFIGMLIENHAGALPAWLAPQHAVVCCISESSADYADEISKALVKQGFRVFSDLRGEKITRKIREHSLQKIPYILVVGDKERESGAVAVRGRGKLDLGVMPVADFSARLRHDIETRYQGGESGQA
jgi:threonyl-tRNA synthetase